MENELQKSLATILNKTIEAADAGVKFLNEQLPDVIQQLLVWHAVKSGILFIALVTLAIVSGWFAKRAAQKGVATKGDYLSMAKEGWYLGAFGMGSGSLILIFAALYELAWLQILVAPKIFLIEYAASLVK